MFVHIILLLEIAKQYFGLNLSSYLFTNNKSIELLLFSLCIAIVYWYYSEKRILKLETRYAENDSIIYYGGWVVSLLIFVPLLLILIIGYEG